MVGDTKCCGVEVFLRGCSFWERRVIVRCACAKAFGRIRLAIPEGSDGPAAKCLVRWRASHENWLIR
jgi:hypothetical protein